MCIAVFFIAKEKKEYVLKYMFLCYPLSFQMCSTHSKDYSNQLQINFPLSSMSTSLPSPSPLHIKMSIIRVPYQMVVPFEIRSTNFTHKWPQIRVRLSVLPQLLPLLERVPTHFTLKRMRLPLSMRVHVPFTLDWTHKLLVTLIASGEPLKPSRPPGRVQWFSGHFFLSINTVLLLVFLLVQRAPHLLPGIRIMKDTSLLQHNPILNMLIRMKQFKVFLTVALLIKVLLTVLALVRTLICVHHEMHPQIAFRSQAITQGTFINSGQCLTLCAALTVFDPEVGLQIIPSCKLLRTQSAVVGFVLGVH